MLSTVLQFTSFVSNSYWWHSYGICTLFTYISNIYHIKLLTWGRGLWRDTKRRLCILDVKSSSVDFPSLSLCFFIKVFIFYHHLW